MKVNNLEPDTRIAGYVERILVIESDGFAMPFSLPLFANGSPTLLFTSTKGIIGSNFATYLTLFGQTILPETMTFTESFTLIAYFFKPYSLLSVFGVAAQEITDRPIDLNLMAGRNTKRLQDQLLNVESVNSRINLLNNYIFGLISAAKKDCLIVKYAAMRIACNPSKTVLGLVQKELYTTERTFQRMFEKNIGIAPNIYRRVSQFNNAFQQLSKRKFDKLTDIAFENGYADQSHYIRSFREFTNLTPGEFINLGPRPQGK